MSQRSRRPPLLLAATGLAALACLFATTPPAGAATDSPGASIDHAESGPKGLTMLVSVPGSDQIDLSTVKVTIGGKPAPAVASGADTGEVNRTAVLAIDTSKSMAGKKITAAVAAAKTYLSIVPADVSVGVVTFDDRVRQVVAPTRDRAAATAALEHMSLRLNTHLYDGVRRALDATGPKSAGQRTVVVLTDGKDTTGASLSSLTKQVKASGTKVDVVTLEQGGNSAIRTIAQAGRGTVIDAGKTSALQGAFSAEAAALARQISVVAEVPKGSPADSEVAVAIEAGANHFTTSAYLPLKASSQDAAAAPAKAGLSAVPAPHGGFGLPLWAVLGVVVLLGVTVVALAAPAGGPKNAVSTGTLDDQFAAYGAQAAGSGNEEREELTIAAQARLAAEKALRNNRNLEARIAARLESAGMAMKPAEWLLVHGCAAFASAMIGLALSRGNLAAMVLFLLLGAVGPWVYLGLKKGRRLKAFNASLADTLQLMSGSLSAGLSLAQSIDTIVREGADPMSSEFKRVTVESRLGVPLEDSLDGVADRMESKDFRWVVMAIRIQRQVGGNLAELLLTVAATLREREYLRRHVKALSAEGRLSAYILGGLPPVFLLYLTVTKPDYVHPLFSTPIGWLMLGGGVVMLGVGFFWMMKVAKVDV